MLKHLKFLGAWLTAICFVATVNAENTIPWATDLSAAFSKASQENKLVLIHFWSPSCGPCLNLERNVFNQSFVGQQLSQKYVPVRIDGTRERKIAERYKVRSWPTDVIVTPAGYVVASSGCSQNAQQYVSKLEDIASKQGASRQGIMPRGPGMAPQTREQLASNHAVAPASATWPNQDYVYGNSQPASAGQSYLPPQANAVNRPVFQQPNGYASQNGPYRPGSTGRPESTGPIPGGQAAAFGDSMQPSMQSQPGYATNGLAQQNNNPYVNNVPGTPLPGANAGLTSANPYARPQGQNQVASNQLQQQAVSNPYAASNDFATASGLVPQGGNFGSPTNPRQALPPGQQSTFSANPWQQSQAPAGQIPSYNSGLPPQQQSPMNMANNQQRSSAGVPARTQAQAGPSGRPPLALDGYCAVTLVEKVSWKKGDVRWGGIHRGRTYLFGSEAEQKAFLANPERYTPALSGIDPVAFFDRGQSVDGIRQYGVYYRDHFYLFSSEQSLQTFWGNPQDYASRVRQAMLQSAGGQGRR